MNERVNEQNHTINLLLKLNILTEKAIVIVLLFVLMC